MILPAAVATLVFGLVLGDQQIARFERLAAADIAAKLGGQDKRVLVKADFGGLISAVSGDVNVGTIEASRFTTVGLPLFTEPDRSQRGKIRILIIKLSNFELSGLRVQELYAKIPNCRYDFGLAMKRGQIRLSRSGVGMGCVRLNENDLSNYILRKFHEVKKCQVELRGGKIIVRGYGEFVVAKAEFFVIASVNSPDGNQIVLQDAQIRLSGGSDSAASRKVLLDILNPVVDLSKDLNLLDAISLQRIEIRDGHLIASGSTKIPEAPRP